MGIGEVLACHCISKNHLRIRSLSSAICMNFFRPLIEGFTTTLTTRHALYIGSGPRAEIAGCCDVTPCHCPDGVCTLGFLT